METEINLSAPQPAVIAPPSAPEIRLDLGAGENCREGFESVDFFAPYAKHKVNLMRFPWPWADSSVSEIHCSHFLEHLPMVYVGLDGTIRSTPEDPTDQDLLFRFMDECWRILKSTGTMTVIVPNARSNRGFQDPTHRRFFVVETFFYFGKKFREVNKLSHYTCRCDFEHVIQGIGIDPVDMVRHQEVQAQRFSQLWNTVPDWMAILKAVKP